jgi:hypothetical protein
MKKGTNVKIDAAGYRGVKGTVVGEREVPASGKIADVKIDAGQGVPVKTVGFVVEAIELVR